MKTRTTITLTAAALLAGTAAAGFLFPYRVEHRATATATADQAWKVIADLPGHSTWNPHTVELSGTPEVGETLLNRTRSSGTEFTFRPVVLVADPGRELRWRGTTGIRGVADGEHYFRIEPGPTADTVTVVQGEEFRGATVPLLRPFLDLEEEFATSTDALAAAITAHAGG